MAQALAGLIGHEARRAVEIGHTLAQDAGLSDRPAQALAEWEEHVRSSIEQNPTIPETEKQQLVLSRRGQGKFRDNVPRIETHCRVTGVNRPEHLIASHCKPWRDSDNAERLDGENGGELLVSPVAHEVSLRKMGVPVGQRVNVGGFSQGQRRYLEFHRESVFLQAVRR
jgi:putative restriction endonuclease